MEIVVLCQHLVTALKEKAEDSESEGGLLGHEREEDTGNPNSVKTAHKGLPLA